MKEKELSAQSGKSVSENLSDFYSQDLERAYRWLVETEEFDVRNLRSLIIQHRVSGADCFDLRGAAKVLESYVAAERVRLLRELAQPINELLLRFGVRSGECYTCDVKYAKYKRHAADCPIPELERLAEEQ